jgi:hypothetical protein
MRHVTMKLSADGSSAECTRHRDGMLASLLLLTFGEALRWTKERRMRAVKRRRRHIATHRKVGIDLAARS